MNNVCELLNLPPRDVQNLSDSFSGYARILQEYSPTEYSQIGSCWMIAAIYQSLISPEEAKKYYFNASQAYFNTDSAFYDICLLCSDSVSITIKEDFVLSSDTKFFRRLRKILSNEEYLDLDFVQNDLGQISHIQIPYDLIYRGIKEVQNYDYYSYPLLADSSIPITKDITNRFGELIDIYMSDDCWRKLEGNVLPYEPSIMAILVMMFELMKKKGILDQFLQNNENRHESVKALLQIAKGIVIGQDPNVEYS
jgi:hypothetical protein